MTKRKDITLPQAYTEKLFNRLGSPLIVQPKIEGDRIRARMYSGIPTLLSSSAAVRNSLPHIQNELLRSPFHEIELDGEAYKHGWKHSQIRSVVSRTRNLHPNHEAIEYWVYDIVSGAPQIERLDNLRGCKTACDWKYIKFVPFKVIYTLDEFQHYYDVCLEKGFEGIIARHMTAPYVRKKTPYLIKLKPRLSEYFEIQGVEEERDKYGRLKNTFGAFTCVTSDGEETFSVGSGPTKMQRQLFWKHRESFKGQEVKVRFQGYTNARNVPKMQSIDSEWLTLMEKILHAL
ncbi:MAG: hypothetical protein GY820_16965 [Gammaproteobacteria bacterium]|nr:hypothetical protein [Gammaproteobacteria bacterium]